MVGIDRRFIQAAVDYGEGHGIKPCKEVIKLLNERLTTQYYDQSNEIVAKKRCRKVLEYFMATGMGRSERKEYAAVVKYLAQLKEKPYQQIDYEGKDTTIQKYLTTGKGEEHFMVNNSFIESLENVKKYISENISVLYAQLEIAKERQDNDQMDDIQRTIEKYKEVLDGVESLRATVPEARSEVLKNLKKLVDLVKNHRTQIRFGEYISNLNDKNPASCFVRMNNEISEAKQVYQTSFKTKKVKPWMEDTIVYGNQPVFTGLIGLSEKKKTYNELLNRIENELAARKRVQPQTSVRLQKLQGEREGLIAQKNEIQRKVQNGEMRKDVGDQQARNLRERFMSVQEQISIIMQAEGDNASVADEYSVIWTYISTEIVSFVFNSSAAELRDFIDDIIGALRNTLAFITGDTEQGQNIVSLHGAQDCVQMLKIVRLQSEERRKIVQEELRKEMDKYRQEREEFLKSYARSPIAQTANPNDDPYDWGDDPVGGDAGGDGFDLHERPVTTGYDSINND